MRQTSSVDPSELDDIFKVLAAQPRRVILQELIDDEVTEVEGLIEALVAHNPEWQSEDSDMLLSMLFHHHLPFLARVGLVEYDPHSEIVHYNEHEMIEAHLALVEDHA